MNSLFENSFFSPAEVSILDKDRVGCNDVIEKLQEIEKNTKFNVRPKLCHIWLNSQAFRALLLRQAIKLNLANWVKYDTILVGH